MAPRTFSVLAILVVALALALQAAPLDVNFLAPMMFDTGAELGSLSDVEPGDFNGDGVIDLAVLTTAVGGVGVQFLIGDGAGGLFNEHTLLVPYASGIGSGDVNGDGYRDLAVTQSGVKLTGDGFCPPLASGAIDQRPATLVFLGSGGGGSAFSFAACLPGLAISHNLTDVIAADFNHDGRADLAVTDAGVRSVRVYRGAGDGTFLTPINATDINGQVLSNLPVSGPLTAADMNGDGRLDLVARQGSVGTFFGDGTGGLMFSSTPVGSALYQHLGVQAFAVADLNGDGLPDIAGVERGVGVAGGAANNYVFASLNSGNGVGYSFSQPLLFPLGTVGRVALADLNRDGAAELIAVHESGDRVRVYLGVGDGTFVSTPLASDGFAGTPVGVGLQPRLLAVMPLDADAWLDLAVVDRNGGNQSRTWVLRQVPPSNEPPTKDTTPPVLTLPANFQVEAMSSAGAPAAFVATARDDVDSDVPVVCTPASGSLFSLGTTSVACEAVDSSGNVARGSFTITVIDTAAPVLTLPANQVVNAAGADGALVTFVATALDVVDGAVPVTCAPASGSRFPIGTTTVNCTAADARDNTAHGTFTVSVLAPSVAPVITLVTMPRTIEVLNPFAYQFSASGTAPLNWSLVVAPAGMTIDAATGLLAWSPLAPQLGTHSLAVRVTSSAGSATWSGYIKVVDLRPPTTPVLSVSDISGDRVTLSWSAAVDNVQVEQYRVYQFLRLASGTYGWVCIQTVRGLSVTLAGLIPGPAYIYAVTAVDSSGNQSPMSARVVVTTLVTTGSSQ